MPRVRFTMRWMMFAVAIAAILFRILAPFWPDRRVDERRLREEACNSSVFQISLALRTYSDDHGRFPRPFEVDERGVRRHSWRAVVSRLYPLRNIGGDAYDPDQPWHGPANGRLEVPRDVQCPSESRDDPRGSPFVMINDFGELWWYEVPPDAILVLESWGANKNWLDPNDRVALSPRVSVDRTDHPRGFAVVLGNLDVVRVQDPGRIKKVGKFYVLVR